ncbi:MAG: D-glycero-alpha-D-manno-heptose-1,7-bisphosphate 7-phosphatase [Acidimicrobiales bacterium]|jgi:D-sedoheptulose 7-phosphate isomerase/D-glycero-D-manno-heptose 1,7-bisphosphate phosphatase
MTGSASALVPDAELLSAGALAPATLARRPTPDAQGITGPPKSQQGPRPGLLLDRDGTVIVDHGYVGSVDRVQFIDGVPEAIARFNNAGIPVAVLSNQAGVARGFYGTDDVERVNAYIAATLRQHGAHIDLFLYCPYHPDGVVPAFARTSEFRKPRPGMARAAAQALNLDLSTSWVVGDRPEDIALAEAVGASAVYVGSGSPPRPGVLSFPSFAAAAPLILERLLR